MFPFRPSADARYYQKSSPIKGRIHAQIMYLPKTNEETDLSVLHELIRSKPLGAWCCISDGEVEVNHLPFVLKESHGEFGMLVGHVARANKVWQTFSKSAQSVILFQGEQAYISPSWYPSKHPEGKAVPTWNYIVAHVYGIPRLIEDPQTLMEHLHELTTLHEAHQPTPWKIADAPPDFIERLAGAIVGIEIPIVKIVGKWKLGQNRSEGDQAGMITGLRSQNCPASQGLADAIVHRKSQRENLAFPAVATPTSAQGPKR